MDVPGGSEDPFDLRRFVEEQRGWYQRALDELRGGHKSGHWIWYVFPQLAGLGTSPVSRHFAISGLDEARAYLAHPVLGPRLRECAATILALTDRTATDIFGDLDAMKVRSSMTLFHRADPADLDVRGVLDRFYGGHPDPRTDQLLAS